MIGNWVSAVRNGASPSFVPIGFRESPKEKTTTASVRTSNASQIRAMFLSILWNFTALRVSDGCSDVSCFRPISFVELPANYAFCAVTGAVSCVISICAWQAGLDFGEVLYVRRDLFPDASREV